MIYFLNWKHRSTSFLYQGVQEDEQQETEADWTGFRFSILIYGDHNKVAGTGTEATAYFSIVVLYVYLISQFSLFGEDLTNKSID